MNEIPFKHPNDTHGGAAKGAEAQRYFEWIIATKYPTYKCIKTSREEDKKGYDYVIVTEKGKRYRISVSSNFQPLTKDHFKFTVGSEWFDKSRFNSPRVPDVFSMTYDYWWFYHEKLRVFFVFEKKKLQELVNMFAHGNVKNLPRFYKSEIAAKNRGIYVRPRKETKLSDLQIFVPISEGQSYCKKINVDNGAYTGILSK